MATSGQEYAGIDNKMLYRISAQMMDINDMIGMDKLKQTLFNQLIYYLQGLHDNTDYLHTVIMGAPGCGKCLGKNVEVMLYSGQTKLSQDIREGDILMGDDCTPRKVISICSGREEMYRIGDKSSEFIVNANHILTLLVNPEATEAVDICVQDIVDTIDIYFTFKNKVSFDRKYELTVDPYTLGYCLIGSYIDEGELFIETPEDHILDYFKSHKGLITVDNNISYVNAEYFKEYTCIRERQLPDDIIYCRHTVLYSVLSGITDSYRMSCKLNLEEFITLNISDEVLAKQIIAICNIIGITNKVSVSQYAFETPLKTYNNKIYRITVRQVELPSIYSTGHFAKVASSPHHNIHPLQITSIGVGDYYGFELDNSNGRFLLADCTVTHNTTIARLIGEMYKNMGILSPDGSFIIAKREDLVAEYLGQTAIKTKKLLQECNGGVLFIDEVYALGPGKKDQDSFSKEAIDTLNAYLSENKDTFCCIIAGYEEDIKNCFFSVNKGLERRFQWCHKIDNYSSENLVRIFLKLVTDSAWTTNITLSVLVKVIAANTKLFKFSGGDMEKLFSTAKLGHANRIFGKKGVIKRLLTMEDLLAGISIYKSNNVFDNTETLDVFNPMFI